MFLCLLRLRSHAECLATRNRGKQCPLPDINTRQVQTLRGTSPTGPPAPRTLSSEDFSDRSRLPGITHQNHSSHNEEGPVPPLEPGRPKKGGRGGEGAWSGAPTKNPLAASCKSRAMARLTRELLLAFRERPGGCLEYHINYAVCRSPS